jgi:hypothetical protein
MPDTTMHLESDLERFVAEYGFANVLDVLEQLACERANAAPDHVIASRWANFANRLNLASREAPSHA